MEIQPPITDPFAEPRRSRLPRESEMLGWRHIICITAAVVVLLGASLYFNRHSRAISRAANRQRIPLSAMHIENRITDHAYVRCVCSSENAEHGGRAIAVILAIGRFDERGFELPFAACEGENGEVRIVRHDWERESLCSP